MDVPEYATLSAAAWGLWIEQVFGLTPGGVALGYGEELWAEVRAGSDTAVTRIEATS